MGLKNSRPLPHARAELHIAPFLQRRVRSWHLDHVTQLALQRYRSLTKRNCVDALQLVTMLGIHDDAFVRELVQLFLPRTPTRVQCMVDAMEVLIALVLVCHAPSMKSRFDAIFDIMDVNCNGWITPTDLVVLLSAVRRAITKLFCGCVATDTQAANIYTHTLVRSSLVVNNTIAKAALCKHLLTEPHAVHYVKLCTGDDKPKLYVLLEKDTSFLGAIEFSNIQAMQTATLATVRAMIDAQIHHTPLDFAFLCQSRSVARVSERDRQAWSIIPFALRGTPGLRMQTRAHNRRLPLINTTNNFAFTYMGTQLPRYKKRVHEIAPVYKHHGFCLGRRGRIEALMHWRVATNWSGGWLYDQAAIAAASKRDVLLQLRTAKRPCGDSDKCPIVVKSDRGQLIAPQVDSTGDEEEVEDDGWINVSNPQAPHTTGEQQHVLNKRQQCIQWRARVVAMEAQQWRDERVAAARSTTTTTNTVLVHIDDCNDDVVLPSRVVPTVPKIRRRPWKTPFATSKWHVPSRKQKQQLPFTSNNARPISVTLFSERVVLQPASCSFSELEDLHINSNQFLASSSIVLESDDVEVFPVLIIRPIEPLLAIATVSVASESIDDCTAIFKDTSAFVASASYLTPFEYELSRSESNFEALLHHIQRPAALQDALVLNRRDVLSRTMLHDAVDYGHVNVLELLLTARVLLDVQDACGDTALHVAAQRGRVHAVTLLLQANAAPSMRNAAGKTPLLCALETAARVHQQQRQQAYASLRQVIDLLWDRYPLQKLVAVDNDRNTSCLALERAVYGDVLDASRTGNLYRLQQLLDLDKRPIASFINETLAVVRRTALHEATDAGHAAIVDLLLKVGADGYRSDQRTQLPLHIAAYNGAERIASCLVAAFPGTIGAQDASGKTPLLLAVERQHVCVAQLLLAAAATADAAAIVDLQDNRGYTALHYACAHADDALVSALLAAGANPHVAHRTHCIVPTGGRCDLLGVQWKAPALLRRAGVDPSVAGVRQWLNPRNGKDSSALQVSPSSIDVSFDVDSPLEILLRGCKRRPERVGACKRILETVLRGSDASVPIASLPRPTTLAPLLHVAADIAADNRSVACELCRDLVALGVEVNMIHRCTLETALLQECKRVCLVHTKDDSEDATTQLALVRTLIELGANVSLANDRNGESPLGCAAWFGHLALLDLLLETQPDSSYYNRTRSFSPLHFAALGGHVACAKRLLAAPARRSINANDALVAATTDETPLCFAIRSKSVAVVQLLLERDSASASVLSTIQRHTTSFRIDLKLHKQRKRMPQTTAVVSPLTLALEVAQPLASFHDAAAVDDRYIAIAHTRKHVEWQQLDRICLLLATRLGESTVTSGLFTRTDVERASALGYWNVVRELLTHQVVLSSVSATPTRTALHYAAAAGQTGIVTSLVAAGADVNCVITEPRWKRCDTASSTAKRATALRASGPRCSSQLVHKRTLRWSVGALFYALVRGHVETAAKLLVLGADPLRTLPFVETFVAKAGNNASNINERGTITSIVSASLRREAQTLHLLRHEVPHCRVGRSSCNPVVHVARYIARSINTHTPLLLLAVAAGHASVVQLLVDAGNSVFQPVGPSATTAIHVAVACGHVALLERFSALAQSDLSSYVTRDGTSLLETACEHAQLDALTYLLQADDCGRRHFTFATDRNAFERALIACAAHQFVAGFDALIAHGAQPDLHVLVTALQSVVDPPAVAVSVTTSDEQQRTPSTLAVRERTKRPRRTLAPRAQPRYSRHPTKTRHTVARARTLLEAIVPFAATDADLDKFLGAAATFDVLLQLLIICARYEFWFVLERVFVAHTDRFLASTNPIQPALVRALSCCLVLHRAALHNCVALVQFMLALGVPADLHLRAMPAARSPLWYAATRGCVDAFVVLALALPPQALAAGIDYNSRSKRFTVVYRTIQASTSVYAPLHATTTCKWHTMRAFSCVAVPIVQTNAFVIHKLVSYAQRQHRDRTASSNTLLHDASRYGDVLTVNALLRGGADVRALNVRHETALVLAAERRDARGTAVVKRLLDAMATTATASDAVSDKDTKSVALVRCVAQPAPCNLDIAKLLLAAGADASFTTVDSTSQSVSAMQCALASMQFDCVQLLLEHGATLSVQLAEKFLHRVVSTASANRIAAKQSSPPTTSHWRQFTLFAKRTGSQQRLLDVVRIMVQLLEPSHATQALTSDVLHQLVQTAAAFAATVARACDLDKRFWQLVIRALTLHADALQSRTVTLNGSTALHFAVLALERDVVEQLLLDTGVCDVLATDATQQTPLHVVAANGDAPICALLLRALERRALLRGIDAVDQRGRSALHVAVIYGHDAVVELLVQAGASIELRCTAGSNALLYACRCNRIGILIALYKRVQAPSALLLTPAGEHALFVAAQRGAFQIVRWFMKASNSDDSSVAATQQHCLQQRTLLHYASVWGDTAFLRQQLEAATTSLGVASLLNERDAAGYTPLLYAFGFGRVEAFDALLRAGASADVLVDHSSDPRTHPYAAAFSIGSLLEWFAFPGWFTFVTSQLPVREKRRMTLDATIGEDYLMNSSVRRWKMRVPTATTSSSSAAATSRLRLPIRTHNSRSARVRYKTLRTTMRTWRFPQLSLFDFACDVGDAALATFLVSMRLPLLLRRSTYQSQRRNMLQAVRWNRLDIVQSLLAAAGSSLSASASPLPPLTEATRHTDGLHFRDFLEVAIDCAVSRGHEDVAIILLAHWNGIGSGQRNDEERLDSDDDTASVFAFQFAHVLQIACIRRMTKLIAYLIDRGGEQLVAFHAHDGPALVYAIGFGHVDVTMQLLAAGAQFSSLHTYVAPSAKKWAELGCNESIQLPLDSVATTAVNDETTKTTTAQEAFVGPLETYDMASATACARLSTEELIAAFAPAKAAVVLPKNES